MSNVTTITPFHAYLVISALWGIADVTFLAIVFGIVAIIEAFFEVKENRL